MHCGVKMIHEPWCPLKVLGHTDAAKRMSDTYNLHRIGAGDDAIGKWFAAALHDGTTDDVLYDSKRDAVIHQHHDEQWYTYIKINPMSSNPCEMEVMLKTARSLYDKGLRMADPTDKRGGLDVIKRLSVEDQMAQARGRNTNLVMPWEA